MSLKEFTMKLDFLEAASADERKLKRELAALGLPATNYHVDDKGFIQTGIGANKVKYKPEMAHDENYVKDGKLVHKWGDVYGDFSVRNLGLTSFENCPTAVYGSFDCAVNRLTSFEHAPKWVTDDFICTQNNITDLTGIEQHVKNVTRGFYFSDKKVKKGGLHLLLIEDLRDISDHIEPFKIIHKYLGKPNQIFDCQQELIEAGYEEYAE